MCEYCSCRGVPPIAELMDEHTALVDEAHHVRQALSVEDHATARSRLTVLVEHLDRHVRREEAGIFRALRSTGEFIDEVDALEGEHRRFTTSISGIDPESPDFAAHVIRLLDDLDAHAEREDLGVFPVSVVTLGTSGWQIVDQSHQKSPSFLLDPAASRH